MILINRKWDDVENDEMIAELQEWITTQYPLLEVSKSDLTILTYHCPIIYPLTIEKVEARNCCTVSDNVIEQCKLIYPEVII